jgi:hypothetical protein
MLADTVPSRPAGDLDDEALLVEAQGPKRFDLTVVEMLLTAPPEAAYHLVRSWD